MVTLLPFLGGGCVFGQGNRADTFLDKMQERFASCDADHDGYLTATETEDCMPRVAEHFAEFDADNDGKVSFDEISAYVRSRRGAS
jgi:Ca2+-binding EF-hand superfamily protein